MNFHDTIIPLPKKNMRKLLIVAFAILASIPYTALYAEDGTTYEVNLKRDSTTIPDTPIHGQRSPSCVNTCIINESGLLIPGVDNSEILSYEVINEDGICLGEFYDEFEFVNFVFSFSQSIEIKIYTETYIYSGYIFIE